MSKQYLKLVLGLGALELVASHIRRRRRGAETVEVMREMAVVQKQRIVGIGMRSPAFGQDNDCTEIHGTSPEFGEGWTLDFDVLDPLGVFRGLDGRNNFCELNLDDACVSGGGIDVNAFGRAVEIAGLGVPVLAFAFVHGELDGVAVGAMEGGVFV